MPRPSVGNLPQDVSKAALAAHVATTLAGVGTERKLRDLWVDRELDLALRSNGLERAARGARGALHDWLLVDTESFGRDLETALVVFPGSGRGRPGLIDRVRSTDAVRQLIVTRSRRDVVCVLLFPPTERDRIFRELDSTGEPMAWEDVLEEDRQIESIAWQAIARSFGGNEGFGRPPGSTESN